MAEKGLVNAHKNILEQKEESHIAKIAFIKFYIIRKSENDLVKKSREKKGEEHFRLRTSHAAFFAH